ncbi:MAG TPA: hydantoinase/oxoprolinase family protein, partial [Acidimicrobiia bacterium]
MRLGVDVGGTFTDLIGWDGHRVVVGKMLTTPDQAEGVLEGARALMGSQTTEVLLHGTTAATNAVLEGRGARVALVTNRGLEDVIEIARQDRPSLYDPMADRPEPLVPRHLRFGMAERPGAGGDSGPLSHEDEVASGRPEAVAVALLYAFENGAAEEELSERLSKVLAGVPISLSSRVVPEFREYERVSTTVLNAYLMPLVGAYLRSLQRRGSEDRAATNVLVMRSSGGLMAIEAAQDLPTAVLLSGPAGGAMASAALSRAHSLQRAVSFDMGGTSTDVCRIE